ncbi:MAG: redox-regulated ATPase YchF [Anaerolineales bacterium]|nr:redox-regulated ATPase YchF [Anaerolineales bacterium]
MALSIGIVGLPNVGKSTTFNALTKEQNAEAANYPFCTIEPNKAIVTVPDARLDKLVELVNPAKTIYATVEFVDIAGLVQGASKGEGLGNKFLGNIRDTSAIVHVVRCFQDENVLYNDNRSEPDPISDIEIINTELILADIEQLERKIERLSRQVKGDKGLKPVQEMAESILNHLETGQPVRTAPGQEMPAYAALVDEMRFLTAKPVIYAANVDEDSLPDGNDFVAQVRQLAEEEGAEVIMLCARLEEEMAGLSEEERAEFLDSMGVEESGLDQIIRRGYHTLGLISYLTAGPKEVRAWTIVEGQTAPQAAGVIHTDFEKGFIRAEVIPFDVYAKHGSETAVKAAGEMRTEGKTYVVKDGDVMHFRFNV